MSTKRRTVAIATCALFLITIASANAKLDDFRHFDEHGDVISVKILNRPQNWSTEIEMSVDMDITKNREDVIEFTGLLGQIFAFYYTEKSVVVSTSDNGIHSTYRFYPWETNIHMENSEASLAIQLNNYGTVVEMKENNSRLEYDFSSNSYTTHDGVNTYRRRIKPRRVMENAGSIRYIDNSYTFQNSVGHLTVVNNSLNGSISLNSAWRHGTFMAGRDYLEIYAYSAHIIVQKYTEPADEITFERRKDVVRISTIDKSCETEIYTRRDVPDGYRYRLLFKDRHANVEELHVNQEVLQVSILNSNGTLRFNKHEKKAIISGQKRDHIRVLIENEAVIEMKYMDEKVMLITSFSPESLLSEFLKNTTYSTMGLICTRGLPHVEHIDLDGSAVSEPWNLEEVIVGGNVIYARRNISLADGSELEDRHFWRLNNSRSFSTFRLNNFFIPNTTLFTFFLESGMTMNLSCSNYFVQVYDRDETLGDTVLRSRKIILRSTKTVRHAVRVDENESGQTVFIEGAAGTMKIKNETVEMNGALSNVRISKKNMSLPKKWYL